MKASVSNIVAGLLLIGIGYASGQSRHGPAQIVTKYDTLAAAAYQQKLAASRIEADGWRARFEAIERRPPEIIYRTDTLVAPPDTVFEFVTVRDGRVTASVLLRGDGTAETGLWTPELHTGSDISDCDEGFEVGPGGVICDRAAFGHLWIGPAFSNTDPMLSAWWRPSYRSPWEAWIGYGTRLHVGARWGWRLF